jgi:hypothetical protein
MISIAASLWQALLLHVLYLYIRVARLLCKLLSRQNNSARGLSARSKCSSFECRQSNLKSKVMENWVMCRIGVIYCHKRILPILELLH